MVPCISVILQGVKKYVGYKTCTVWREEEEEGEAKYLQAVLLIHTTHTPSLFPSMQPHPPPYNVTELTVKTAVFTGGQVASEGQGT